jgi:hypothetical protein
MRRNRYLGACDKAYKPSPARRRTAAIDEHAGLDRNRPAKRRNRRSPSANYFNAPLTSENSALRAAPRFVNMVTNATAIRLAINAYSIAVAPLSSSPPAAAPREAGPSRRGPRNKGANSLPLSGRFSVPIPGGINSLLLRINSLLPRIEFPVVVELIPCSVAQGIQFDSLANR